MVDVKALRELADDMERGQRDNPEVKLIQREWFEYDTLGKVTGACALGFAKLGRIQNSKLASIKAILEEYEKVGEIDVPFTPTVDNYGHLGVVEQILRVNNSGVSLEAIIDWLRHPKEKNT